MLEDFIHQTENFLRYSDIRFRYPSVQRVTFGADGSRHWHLSSYCCNGLAEIKENLVVTITVLFTLLDMLVDKRHPDLEGKEFVFRYEQLKKFGSTTDHDIIFRELYRIMILIRNGIVHSRSKLTDSSADFSITCGRKNNFGLTMQTQTLSLIFTAIMLLTRQPVGPYLTSILRTYYDDIGNGIISISDKNGSGLDIISGGTRLKRVVRCRVENPQYRVDNDRKTLIISRLELDDVQKQWSSPEYCVSLNKERYLIPDEILNATGEIFLSDVSPWIYDAAGQFI
jgi:hypothetical protein